MAYGWYEWTCDTDTGSTGRNNVSQTKPIKCHVLDLVVVVAVVVQRH
jgi:hypothetical protein